MSLNDLNFYLPGLYIYFPTYKRDDVIMMRKQRSKERRMRWA